MQDFDYLPENKIYLDSACQSLRPRPVIDALNAYYKTHNSCGERVKYQWGIETDKKVNATREKLLKYLKLKSRDYFVSFTLNTTYGINLLLQQLKPAGIKKIITTDIEHNSPFLATLGFSRRHDIPREIITRNSDGSLPLDSYRPHNATDQSDDLAEEIPVDFTDSVLVLNCVSNVDSRRLENIKAVIKRAHKENALVIIDAAQALAHDKFILEKTDADAICFSAHKMYAPSLGGIIIKRKVAKTRFNHFFLGGGMVDDVDTENFLLSADNPDNAHTQFEPGLQAWGEIVALGAALDWLNDRKKSDYEDLENNAKKLHDFIADKSGLHLVNPDSLGPTMSFYSDKIDSHLLGAALADQGIMARTGYFCVHYYLDHVLHLPPLVRFSLGFHTRSSDIKHVISALEEL